MWGTSIYAFCGISGNKIKVVGNTTAGTITDGDVLNLTVNHETVSRTDYTNINLASSNAADTIGQNVVQLYILDGSTTGGKINGIQTDSSGHVEGIQGSLITFQHNFIDTITPVYGASSSNITLNTTDNIGKTASGTIKYASSTLQIKGGKSNGSLANPDQLEIDLVWGTF